MCSNNIVLHNLQITRIILNSLPYFKYLFFKDTMSFTKTVTILELN